VVGVSKVVTAKVAKPMVIEYAPTRTVKPWPKNPRKISPEAKARLWKILDRFGLREPLTVRAETKHLLGGHRRHEWALARGLETIPVVKHRGLSDEEAEALNVALNNREAQGEFDLGPLADILSELQLKGFDATLTGFGTDDVKRMLAKAGHNGHEEGEVDLTAPAEPKSKRGEVYELGRHRLMCGDATSAENVASLLNGVQPNLMVTDPPYGVGYDPKWRNEAAEKGLIAFAASREGVVANDDRIDWHEAWALFPGDVAYCWHADRHASTVQASLEEVGFEIRAQVIWAKPRFVISRGHYHWQHEPCWYAVRKDANAGWCGDRSQTTLWEIPLLDDTDQKEHSTQKPTECMERPIRNHEGDVYDPFVGTGTTIIAAERQGRVCYAMEIEPTYCDVIRRRYAAYVGKPELAP
jgi:DNA modification methylase